MPSAEQLEKDKQKKRVIEEQRLAQLTNEEEMEIEAEEENMEKEKELLNKIQPQRPSTLHEIELKFKTQQQSKVDYFSSIKDDEAGEEDTEGPVAPKLRIKGISVVSFDYNLFKC